MIEAQGLTRRFGSIYAVRDLAFQAGEGEILGFLGPNGAGKTTTMRMLTGLLEPSNGTAVVAGFDVRQSPLDVKRRVGYLPETVPLYREMIVRSYLHYVAEAKGLPRRGRRTAVDRVVDRCGLREVAHRVVGHLSRGYRQRTGLAQALLGEPPVLILDEPTAGLDPKQIVEIRTLIKELAASHTVLLCTHILAEVVAVCRRALIINDGRLAAEGPVATLAGGGGAESLEATFMRVISEQSAAVD